MSRLIPGSYLHAVENRGSGIRAMLHALREANLEPPRFDDRRSSFLVTFRNHTLMSPEAINWLNQFANVPLNDRQRLAAWGRSCVVVLTAHNTTTPPETRPILDLI
jgi:predicted HTH transcriptional regulator